MASPTVTFSNLSLPESVPTLVTTGVGARGGSPAPAPVAAALLGGSVGTAYSETIAALGGTSPYTFSITSGALPSGLTLNASTGVISGTPTGTGTYNFTVKVVDANGNTQSYGFTIVIGAAGGGAGSGNYGWSS